MEWLLVVIRVVHIGAGIAAGGALAYQLLALRPALAALPDVQRVELRGALAARWFPIVLVLLVLLLASGLANYLVFKIPLYRTHPDKGLYHALFGLKFLAALGVLHLATVLSMPGPRGDRWREKAGLWLCLALTLLVVVIVAGALLGNFAALFPPPVAGLAQAG
jgi:hypothetical protein